MLVWPMSYGLHESDMLYFRPRQLLLRLFYQSPHVMLLINFNLFFSIVMLV